MNTYRKELLTPDGERYVATSPVEANNLIYGSGYREAESSDTENPAPTPAANTPKSASPLPAGGEKSP